MSISGTTITYGKYIVAVVSLVHKLLNYATENGTEMDHPDSEPANSAAMQSYFASSVKVRSQWLPN